MLDSGNLVLLVPSQLDLLTKEVVLCEQQPETVMLQADICRTAFYSACDFLLSFFSETFPQNEILHYSFIKCKMIDM